MTEQVPGYVTALLFFVAILTVATMAAFAAAVVTFIVGACKGLARDDDEEDGWGNGSGGWTGKPGPPGGGGGNDRNLHEQFHAVADAVGKVIEAEKKQPEGEKVGIRC
jgi:hypothetical protein